MKDFADGNVRWALVCAVAAGLCLFLTGCGLAGYGIKKTPDPAKIAAVAELNSLQAKNMHMKAEIQVMEQQMQGMKQEQEQISRKAREATAQLVAAREEAARLPAPRFVEPAPVVEEPENDPWEETPAPAYSEPVIEETPDSAYSQPVKAATPTKPKIVWASPEQLYATAFATYKTGSGELALEYFNEFLRTYPIHDLSDNAQYWIGEVYYDQRDYASAVDAFMKVVASYPDQPKVPDAMLKIGYSYVQMGNMSKAKDFLHQVVRNYPLSMVARKAQEKLGSI